MNSSLLREACPCVVDDDPLSGPANLFGRPVQPRAVDRRPFSCLHRRGFRRLGKSSGDLAAQTEFSEPGEPGLFIDAVHIHFLEYLTWTRGYLDRRQMGEAFQMLRYNDLPWSRIIHDSLMGESEPISDLLAWNSEGTRLPLAMHSQYLRGLFLDDDLAEGRYMVEGRSIALSDICVPIFAVGTEWDHVAPWRSVFKIHLLTETEVTFLLTSGGHNAGIVPEPGYPTRYFQIMPHAKSGGHVDPDMWPARAERHDGSWWPACGRWLASRAGQFSPPLAPSAPDKGLAPQGGTPGSYVLER